MYFWLNSGLKEYHIDMYKILEDKKLYIHDKNTHFNYNLHLPSTNLTLVQKEVLYSGSKIYNHLPLSIKMLSKDAKQFKSTPRSYLVEHTWSDTKKTRLTLQLGNQEWEGRDKQMAIDHVLACSQCYKTQLDLFTQYE
jgi:hypothetical protein